MTQEIDIIDGVPGLVHTADLSVHLPAWQEYLDRFVCPAWHLDKFHLNFCPTVKAADPSHWWIVVNGHSDVSGALGYHAVQPNGMPFSRIFAADDIANGNDLSVTLTHELAEMVVDPQTTKMVTIQGRVYIVEVCDAVESDLLAFDVQGTKCSDFVLPSYFAEGGGPWDQQRRLAGPCPRMLPGGYLAWEQNGIWHQTFARLENGSQSFRSRRYGRAAQKAALE